MSDEQTVDLGEEMDPEPEDEVLSFEAYVEAADLLDVYVPDWLGRIDLDRLSMTDSDCCILGQLFEEYAQGQEDLMDLGWDDVEAYHAFDWDASTEEWRRLIIQRRGESE